MKEIIGRQYSIETNEPEKVIGRFNNNLMKKLLCCLNEAMSYEMIEKSSKIKGLATEANHLMIPVAVNCTQIAGTGWRPSNNSA